jgi:DNA-damage-inducible protein D
MEQNNKIVLFQENTIRRIWHNEAWWFAVVDVIAVLTESTNPGVYWRVMKKRLSEEGANESVTNCNSFKFAAADGKMRSVDCANTQTLLRLIMSIPSPKAEPFKQWLAQVGQERMEEIENPEIAIERARDIYKAKGYSDKWIDSRLKSINIRKELTDEWKERGVNEGQEYSILTAEIAKATFGLIPSEHKNLKSLDKENLRDHMTNLELIFSMLGEESTRLFAIEGDAQGFHENFETAQKGGKAAGDARRNFEKSGQKVVSNTNFLKQIEEAEKENTLPSESGGVENTEG